MLAVPWFGTSVACNRKSPSSNVTGSAGFIAQEACRENPQRVADAVPGDETHSTRQFARRKPQLAAAQLFFLRRQLGTPYLNLLQFFLNHRTFLRSHVPNASAKAQKN